MSTLAELLLVQTPGEILDAKSAELATLGVSPRGWEKESVQYALLDLFCRAESAEQEKRSYVSRGCSRILAMQITDAATRNAWIDVIAQGFYNLDRFPAVPARHLFSVNMSASGSPVDIAPRTRIAVTPDRLQFINTGRRAGSLTDPPGTIRLSPSTSIMLEFECMTAGTVGNIAPQIPLTLATPIAGVTVTNTAITSSIVVRGSDTESTESLDGRCSARWGRTAVGQMPGSLVEWIHEAFTTADLPSPVTRWRIDDENPNGPGSTDVILSEESGPALSETIARVDAYLQARRAVGTGILRTRSAVVRNGSFSADIWTYGNSETNITDATTAIRIVESVEPIGGIVYPSDIVAAIRSVPDIYDVTNLTITEPIVLAGDEVIAFTPTLTEH